MLLYHASLLLKKGHGCRHVNFLSYSHHSITYPGAHSYPNPTQIQSNAERVPTPSSDSPTFRNPVPSVNDTGRTSIIDCAITRGAFEPYRSCFGFRPQDDLRITGFMDLGCFYTRFSHQMGMYFECAGRARGYDFFKREGWGFKHDRLTVERVSEAPADSENANLKVRDMARLMELFRAPCSNTGNTELPVEPSSEDEGEGKKPPPPKVEEE
ncbi:hypothetical protein JAAARDRAFT_412812 [Jaapia argillacea MUCL 33604]|uniref:Uncharacterized protein n=1 Tax=Jaapia argillacea MUCL 33604 TaxID=933084 RepID=A0A067PUV5_9AGAM|nr:hypothetical protein JAAARDRAFT_412812 [Jaapia argillacea MUCL 33604]